MKKKYWIISAILLALILSVIIICIAVNKGGDSDNESPSKHSASSEEDVSIGDKNQEENITDTDGVLTDKELEDLADAWNNEVVGNTTTEGETSAESSKNKVESDDSSDKNVDDKNDTDKDDADKDDADKDGSTSGEEESPAESDAPNLTTDDKGFAF